MQKAGAKFAKWVDVQKLKRDLIKFGFTASESERAALAQELGIVGIAYLKADVKVERREGSNLLELSAKFKADVSQSCVISLKPVAQKIELEFMLCYTFNKNDVGIEDAEYNVSSEENDLPELIEDGRIDAVRAISEQIALALDPYPRAEGAENIVSADYVQQSVEGAEGLEREVHKPFANLKDLMNKK